jgi:predicted RNA binding protein YcfA (HicA-like mRNA interferase family)
VVIPLHAGDLAPRTIKSILAQAELTAEDLTELK